MPAVTVFQRYPEQATIELENPQVDQEWAAIGSEDPANVYPALVTGLPSTYRGLYLTSYSPVHKGGGVWHVAIHYSRTPPLVKNVFHFAGETTGKTLHRELSLGLVDSYALTGEAPDFDGLIGVSFEGVAGVDTVAPSFTFTITKRFYTVPGIVGDYANSVDSVVFLDTLTRMSPCINIAPFIVIWKGQVFTFQERELLFHGCQISDPGRDLDNNELIEIGYKLEFSKTRSQEDGNPLTNLLGEDIPIDKAGWDYLWVYRERRSLSSNGVTAPVMRPRFVYVEQVYEEDDFMKLKI
jgi:hypothetical protein